MIGLVLAGVSAAASIFGGISANNAAQDAAKQQRELAAANSRFIRLEGFEKVRRTKITHAETLGQTRARIGASNLGGASRAGYIVKMRSEHGKELNWINKSADSRAKIAMLGGEMAAQATSAQGQAALFGGVSSAVGAFSGQGSTIASLF